MNGTLDDILQATKLQRVESTEYSLEKASELLGPGPRHHYAIDLDGLSCVSLINFP
jgi:hypothetical protein